MAYDKDGSNQDVGNGQMFICGPSKTKLTYSSAPTRMNSLAGLQNGAEFNEVNHYQGQCRGEFPEDMAAKFHSCTIYRDIPSCYPGRLTASKIADVTIMPEDMQSGWIRNKGEW